YNPIAVESAWYDWWEAQGFFFKPRTAEDGETRPEGVFVIPMPPPSISVIQDCLIRWNQMLGKTTLFVPGFDHAGISTQSVVEKWLYKVEGKTRHDLSQEVFLGKVMEWKNEYMIAFWSEHSLTCRPIGGSCDWDRVTFTMSLSLSTAVTETFCRLHEDGIIYHTNQLVNWCVQLNTTLSNLEVDQKQLFGRTLLNIPGYDAKEKFEFGVITSFAYHIEGS
ncbi:Aminoacyl-tRNA synthetase, partial [Suillus placidus]